MRDNFTFEDALNLAQDNVNLADGGRTRMQETHVSFARDNVNLDVNFAQDQVKLARGMLHRSEEVGGRKGRDESPIYIHIYNTYIYIYIYMYISYIYIYVYINTHTHV